MKPQPLWRIVGAYLAGGWLLLQIVDQLGQNAILPPWAYRTALWGLALGLPLVFFTTVIQRGVAIGLRRPTGRLSRLFTWRHAGMMALVLFAAWGAASAVWMAVSNRVDWVRDEGIPEIERLVEGGDWEGAYALARRAAEAAPEDATLAGLWEKFTWLRTIDSRPSGATVYRRAYSDLDGEWELLGATPLEEIHFPFGYSRLRFELDGYEPLTVAEGVTVEAGTNLITWDWFTLEPESDSPSEMLHIPGWEESGLDTTTALGDYLLGRYEVTNREFKEFVDAGGYQRGDLWEHSFQMEGRSVPWAEAMALFVDRTGRSGPSTWMAGDYPDGEDDYPVAGVSWYEAAAYARFRGRELPTVYHWARAFDRRTAAWVLPLSNLDGTGTAPVGAFAGMSPHGAFDLAGNVREWCLNATGDRRFFRGGGWNDPFWVTLQTGQAQSPFDRSETNGFRLAEYPDTSGMERARRPLPEPVVEDHLNRKPAPDRDFEIFRRMYAYDSTPLNARVEAADTTDDWIRQRIVFDAAYGGERVVLFLYLPIRGTPPFQTVIYFPGGAARTLSSIDHYRTIHFDFLLKSGRAVAFPVYKGTFQRPADATGGVNALRDRIIQTVKDLRRSVDYLETRQDIDADKLAYHGYSFGGSWAPYMLANEPRIAAAVLYVGGYAASLDGKPPEIDPFNYVPRINTPVLMLNGATDQNRQPIEQRVHAFFGQIGTPVEQKRLVVEEGGHFVPRPVLIRETLDWLDRFLGRVSQ